MPEPVPVVFILSLAFGLHIALVNLDIGLATLIPIMKRVGERREDEFLVRRAKNLMRYYAMTYATFPSQIMGGPTWTQSRISTTPSRETFSSECSTLSGTVTLRLKYFGNFSAQTSVRVLFLPRWSRP